MNSAALVFPDQLFQEHPALSKERLIFLIEDYLYFRVQPFHKQRLVLLKAAMLEYAGYLKERGYKVHLIESHELHARGDFAVHLAAKGIEDVHLAKPCDDWLVQDIQKAAEDHRWRVHYYPSPGFLCTEEELTRYFDDKSHYSMASFYIYQRKRLDVLMSGGKPMGGKYSFDTENRRRMPKHFAIPKLYTPPSRLSEVKAREYVEREFPQCPGESAPLWYPTTFDGARKALKSFIDTKLAHFGDFQDAIVKDEAFLFHSVLSPMINIGLLTPGIILKELFSATDNMLIPLNSLEGYVRQLIGWREFMRACYLLIGRRVRSSNHFEHQRPIPACFWEGKTGIPPIDYTVQRVIKTGYCHHIERLMVLGNFLLLTETDPHEVYSWFMGNFVDAYDWVMVPNVYSMSQYADGGLITTKPYLSAANYILKMSDFEKGPWVDIWDGLFWRFICNHTELFDMNPRTTFLLKTFEKNPEKYKTKIHVAEKWLMEHYFADRTA